MTSEPSVLKHFCTRCSFQTNHKILFLEIINSNNEYNDYRIKYFVVKCLGCDKTSFRREFHDFDNMYYDSYTDEESPSIYVEEFPKGFEGRKELKDVAYLPKKIRVVFKESIDALKNDCNLLAGVGFRAVIEAICLDNSIKGRTLDDRINNLVKNGLITSNEANRLHSVRFLGNDAVHEMSVPNKNSLLIILDIIEQLLKNLYIIDKQVQFNNIETVISDYTGFLELLNVKISLLALGDELIINKILGKEIRRVLDKLPGFENTLIQEIKNGDYKFLQIGVKKVSEGTNKEFQHFIVIEKPLIDDPF